MPNGACWSECEWKAPSEVVGDCALVPERVQGGSQRDIANPQERVQGIATHLSLFKIRSLIQVFYLVVCARYMGIRFSFHGCHFIDI